MGNKLVKIGVGHKFYVQFFTFISVPSVFFINSIIENPSFTSQTKEELKTRISLFGSKCELSEKKIPFIIKRKYNNGYEYWKLEDLNL